MSTSSFHATMPSGTSAFAGLAPVVLAVFLGFLAVSVPLGALSLGLRFAAHGVRPAALSAVYVVASVIVVTMMIDYDRPERGFVNVDLKPLQIQLQTMQPMH